MNSDLCNSSSVCQKFLLFLVLGFVSIYYVFSPVIHIPFHHHDTYKFSLGDPSKRCSENVGDAFNHNLSRHIAAYTDCANFKYANTLERMTYARLISVILIGLVCALLATWLCSIGISTAAAFFISGSLCVLPGMQTSIIMAAQFIPLTVLIALLSAILLRQTYSLLESNPFSHCRYRVILFFIASIVLIFTSLFSYSALTACFLIPAMISILSNPIDQWKLTRKYVIKDAAVFGFCCLIFFIMAKYHFMKTGQPGIAAYRYDHLNMLFFDRIPTLLRIFTQQSSIYLNYSQFLIVYFVVISGASIALYQVVHSRANLTFSLQATFLTIILLLLSAVVYFLTAELVTAGRIMYAFQAMTVLIIAWALCKWASLFSDKTVRHRIFTGLVGILFLINATYANYYTAKSALNDNLESSYITSSIANYLMQHGNKLKRVHIIPPLKPSFNGLSRSDDIYNYNSSLFTADIPNMAYTALLQLVSRKSIPFYAGCIYSDDHEENFLDQEKKCIELAPSNAIVYTFSFVGQPIYKSPDMLIIDLNTLNPLSNDEKPDLKDLKFK